MSRSDEAKSYHQSCLSRLDKGKTPEGQKFPIGTRVRIADDLGQCMSHFESGCNATVQYTYKQMYGGSDVKSYSLDLDDHGSVSWYNEDQLTEIINVSRGNDPLGQQPTIGFKTPPNTTREEWLEFLKTKGLSEVKNDQGN